MKHKLAIVRQLGRNFTEGQTTKNLGKPDIDKALGQHASYCGALRSCDLEVMVLPALAEYPDCPFVEDTAVITDHFAVITNPGHPTRQGEKETIKSILAQYRKLEFVQSPGKLDGGDVLKINDNFYIGLSERTNDQGAAQLRKILKKYALESYTIPVSTVLHLKTGVTYIGNSNILSTAEFSSHPEFKKLNVIEVPPEENYTANCLYINNYLLVPKSFPKTLKKLKSLGYSTIELEVTEFEKMDGGLTCLSLLLK